MGNIYRMTALENYYKVFENIIYLNSPFIYKIIFKDNISLIRNLFVDWVLTIGFSKLPLNFTGKYLENLVVHGWYFVLKFFASFIKEMETVTMKFINNLKRQVKEVVL